MDKATASSFLNEPSVTVLTCPHCRYERTPRVLAVEKALREGTLGKLYIRIANEHANKVPLFRDSFPQCKVRIVRHNEGKYVLLKLERKDNEHTTRPQPAPIGPGPYSA